VHSRRLAIFQAATVAALFGCKENVVTGSIENSVYQNYITQIMGDMKEPFVIAIWPDAITSSELIGEDEGVARTAMRIDWKSAFENFVSLKSLPDAVNLSSVKIGPKDRLPSLTRKQVERLKNMNGSNEFIAYLGGQLPGVKTALQFSRVGFNTERTHAVMVVRSLPGNYHGSPRFINMMQKIGGQWQLIKDYKLGGGL
jgi:hypothetical protein